MNLTEKQERSLRTLGLIALMIFSVLAGTIAFAGTMAL